MSKPKAIPSLGHRNRFHPYAKEKSAGTGEKKAINRNRVFISNIPYDMKWQSIKDLMREKGNLDLTASFTQEWGKPKRYPRAGLFVLNLLLDISFHSSPAPPLFPLETFALQARMGQ